MNIPINIKAANKRPNQLGWKIHDRAHLLFFTHTLQCFYWLFSRTHVTTPCILPFELEILERMRSRYTRLKGSQFGKYCSTPSSPQLCSGKIVLVVSLKN